MFGPIISGFSFYDILVYFIIFSMAGYVSEVVYAAIVLGKFVNRGFLSGPWCPVYGFGVVSVGIILKPINSRIALLFLGSVVVSSLLEYFTGFILEKVFNRKWWDYSNMRYNLNGYICLRFSLAWGAGCTLIVKLVFPVVDLIIRIIPHAVGIIIFSVVMAVMLGDFAATIIAIAGIKRKLRIIDAVAESIRTNTDDVGEFISRETLAFKDKYEEILALLTLKWSQRRIFTAFPNLKKQNIYARIERLHSLIKESLDKDE